MKDDVRISIVIPTRNGGARLREALDAIDGQSLSESWETIAIDSGSSDGTLELLERRVDLLVRIPPQQFGHGATRNQAVERARGELVVLLVQDAVPASPDWLAALVDPFAHRPALAGAFARQVLPPDAGPIARHYAARWAGSQTTGWTSRIRDAAELAALPPQERLARCTFDNVCSCIRKAVWAQHPFPAAVIAEDLEWAREVLIAGHEIAFVPAALVSHGHERSARYELARTYALHRRLFALFGLRTVPTLGDLGRATVSSLATHARLVTGRGDRRVTPRMMARALALAIVWPLGQYLGARHEARGARALSLGRV